MKLLGVVFLAPCALAQNQGAPAAAAPQPMLLPQAVVLPRGAREIAVDGSLIDWPELPAMRLDDRRQLSGTALEAWRGPNDASAVVFMLWDQEALHVACAVKDEWHRPLDAETLLLTEIPAADSVVLTFDPERNTRALGNDAGRREDREFWLADSAGREVVLWDRMRGTARVLDGNTARSVVLHDKEHGITSYEAKIPWAEILPVGTKPAAALVMDLQVVVNDFDERTDRMPQTRLGWTFGCNSIIDPGLLGSLMLVADAGPMNGAVPEFPPKPSQPADPLSSPAHWQQLSARLLQTPPAVYAGSGAPEAAGGTKRLAVLEEIDSECAKFPRVDFLEFHHRIHRRMLREVAGIAARGLPLWLRQRLESVSKLAENPVSAGTVRLFRLPMGGWLFRTPHGNFVVDAAGADLEDRIWGGSEFCILTQPMDIVRRNDQLLVRMFFAQPRRPVLAHIVFHLPAVPMQDMPLVEPGKSYPQGNGVNVHTLGQKLPDGSVTWSCSYRIEIPKGPKILLVGPDLREAEVEGKADLVILSSRNVEAVKIVQKVEPALVVFDDAFYCHSHPGLVRVKLRDLHALQKALAPQQSLILAPGESWDVTVTR
ncbi:MAG TPA: hypothetical protein VFT55_10230 [Planctomycetota bacterium]|nr:hypothetical protein [Planctomycetota bacterium]